MSLVTEIDKANAFSHRLMAISPSLFAIMKGITKFHPKMMSFEPKNIGGIEFNGSNSVAFINVDQKR